jgi:hypothetical protein
MDCAGNPFRDSRWESACLWGEVITGINRQNVLLIMTMTSLDSVALLRHDRVKENPIGGPLIGNVREGRAPTIVTDWRSLHC